MNLYLDTNLLDIIVRKQQEPLSDKVNDELTLHTIRPCGICLPHGRIKKPRAPGPGHVKGPPPLAKKKIVHSQNTNTIRRIYILPTMSWI